MVVIPATYAIIAIHATSLCWPSLRMLPIQIDVIDLENVGCSQPEANHLVCSIPPKLGNIDCKPLLPIVNVLVVRPFFCKIHCFNFVE
jgi:hypothetical protein